MSITGLPSVTWISWQIEFQVNCLATSEETVEYMHGADMADNPIGVEYDPEAR